MSVPAPICPPNDFRKESSARTTTMVRTGFAPNTSTTSSVNQLGRWRSRRRCTSGKLPDGAFVPTPYITTMWNGTVSPIEHCVAHYRDLLGRTWKIEYSGTCDGASSANGGGWGSPERGLLPSSRYYKDGDYGNSLPFKLAIQNLKNMLNAELLSSLRDQTINLAETLADVRDSIRTVANTFRYLLLAALAAKRGNVQGVKSHLMKALRGSGHAAEIKRLRHGRPPLAKDAAGLYLSYTYAWVPLLTDIYDALNFARSRLLSHHRVRLSRSTPFTGAPSSYVGVQSFKSEVKIQGHISVTYSLTPQFVSLLKDVGLINPLEVAWAAVPYSFVLDWFLPVQQLLQNMTATVDLTFHSGYRTIRTEVSEEVSWYYPEPSLKSVEGGFRHRVRGLSVERERLLTFPPTSLYLDGGLNSNRRMVNATALLLAKLS